MEAYEENTTFSVLLRVTLSSHDTVEDTKFFEPFKLSSSNSTAPNYTPIAYPL